MDYDATIKGGSNIVDSLDNVGKVSSLGNGSPNKLLNVDCILGDSCTGG